MIKFTKGNILTADVDALKDYQILGYSINLLVAQKIAYFLQRIGEWTKRKKEIMKPIHIKIAHNRLKEYYSQKWL